MLLDEFDPNPVAVINANDGMPTAPGTVPEIVVGVFHARMLAGLVASGRTRQVAEFHSTTGAIPVHALDSRGLTVGVTQMLLGAPAAVGQCEEIAQLGARHFVVCGGCGVLASDHPADLLFIPTSALRDEGTSYHYAPASDVIQAQPLALETMRRAFHRHGIAYDEGRVWTTDAYYRETPAKIERRRAMGARVVDMEASALMAWSQFRQVNLYQFFRTEDSVAGESWNARRGDILRDLSEYFDAALAVAAEIIDAPGAIENERR
ncbi:MAG: nucleoside phosphorylase [Propionibacteriaceae bacterium]|jgi:uridine phosphorylase|nr:nucleoside phosphorylase [Propionibacteriaceae bacterium]